MFCFLVVNIIKIQRETLYLNNLLKVSEYIGNKECSAPDFGYTGEKDSLRDRVYKYLKEKNKVVSFEVAEADMISFDGIPDGKVEIDKKAIRAVSFDSHDEKKLEILSRS